MFSILKLTIAPLVSLFIFILGNGLFTTLTTVRLHLDGSNAITIGAMTCVYYAGLVCASFRSERTIIRIGHIRAFSAFASILAVVSLLQGIFVIPWFWLILRFIGGFATAGLFIVIESWLLVLGSIKIRGQVLALYMVTLYGSQAAGQFLINLGDPRTLILFALTAMLSSLSVIPLAMSKVQSPKIEEPSALSFGKLFKKSASGVFGCLSSGLILGAIYGLFPLFISQSSTNPSDIALFMAITIFGGMALQYPVGRLSDRIERRTVLIGITISTILASLFMIYAFDWYWTAIVVTFIFGGLSFTLYPISISHACDHLEAKDLVAGTQGLLLAYGIGASIGPLIAPLFIHLFGANGLFIYFAIISTLLGCFLLWRRVSVAAIDQEENFVALPQTTPVTAELDPRSEE